MIHLVILDGPSSAIKAAVSNIQKLNGYIEVKPDTWLVSTAMNSQELCGYLRNAHELRLYYLVARLYGNWTTLGLPEVTKWLKSSASAF